VAGFCELCGYSRPREAIGGQQGGQIADGLGRLRAVLWMLYVLTESKGPKQQSGKKITTIEGAMRELVVALCGRWEGGQLGGSLPMPQKSLCWWSPPHSQSSAAAPLRGNNNTENSH
jgi:hypothetical protein